jgi:hypothetical protein
MRGDLFTWKKKAGIGKDGAGLSAPRSQLRRRLVNQGARLPDRFVAPRPDLPKAAATPG